MVLRCAVRSPASHPIPHILFGFRPASVYIARESGADVDSDPSNPSLLDLQRRPAPLSLGHTIRKRQGDVAWSRGEGGRDTGPETGEKGDRVLCYHSAPERSLYSIAEVTRDPYPDPHDYDGKNLVADLRAFEKLPRSVTLAEMRANSALRKVKLLKNVRLIISPLTEAEYQELLRMAGIVAMPGVPLL